MKGAHFKYIFTYVNEVFISQNIFGKQNIRRKTGQSTDTGQRLANSFCKGLKSKYFRLYGPYDLRSVPTIKLYCSVKVAIGWMKAESVHCLLTCFRACFCHLDIYVPQAKWSLLNFLLGCVGIPIPCQDFISERQKDCSKYSLQTSTQ